MKISINAIGAIVISIIILSSCNRKKEHIDPTIENSHINNYQVSKDGNIILGKKLDNPYSVENMKIAFANVTSMINGKISADSVSSSPVRTTHYYVRFLPKDWEQYDLLKSDTTLKLYDIPLDYEVTLHGGRYHDPLVPEENPTWQYTAVKSNYTFSNGIKFEILSELYLPESDEQFQQTSSNLKVAGKSFVDALVDEAMILTKNYSDTLNVNSSGLKTAFDPSGTVKVYDTRLGKLIPLVGVRMRARRWFDITETFTDDNGYYRAGSYKRPVNYALYFETNDFDVRSGTYGQAWIDGPKQDRSWNIDLWDGVNRFYAHVFRGARRYHNGNIDGLKRPNAWSKLKYCAYDANNDDIYGDNWGNWDFTGVFPDIRIWRNNNNKERDSDEIFSTTVHETAHASHVQLMNGGEIQFGQVSNSIVESWAVAVQWKITAMEYRERGIPNFIDPWYFNTNIWRLRYSYQNWTKVVDPVYTSLFIDLVDDHNQYGRFGSAIIDSVSGYTLGGIESGFLKHSYGLASLKDRLKANKPISVNDSQIDELLKNF